MARSSIARHPMGWTVDSLGEAITRSPPATANPAAIVVNRIATADLAYALRRGLDDFLACRTDAILLCVVYPVVGLVLSRLVLGAGIMPLLFPLAAGYALLGPLFATGLYAMSRKRERAGEASWADAFSAIGSPAIGSIVTLGLGLCALFTLWLVAAEAIYRVTLGPAMPASLAGFEHALFTTPQGWALILVGVGAGALFAAAVLAIGVVSFPLLLDRNCGVVRAAGASLRAVWLNPVPVAAWGAIVAGILVLGSLPALVGLVVALPVLGHATWHLYRKLITPPVNTP